jgi:hypothetical protein
MLNKACWCVPRSDFLANRYLHDCPTRFDVLAVDNIPGRPQEISLHRDAFRPQLLHAR